MKGPLGLDGMLRQIRHVESSIAILKTLRRVAPEFEGYQQTPNREPSLDEASHRFVLIGAIPDSVESTFEVPVPTDPLYLSAEDLARAAATHIQKLPVRPGYINIRFYIKQ